MKLFTKKTLAILLSALIVMSTVSIISFADPVGKLTTQTVFYDADGNTADKVYAKKGDSVKATISLTSDFNVGTIALLFQFNSDMLELDTGRHTAVSGKEYNLISENSDVSGKFYEMGTGGYNLGNHDVTLGSGKDALYISVESFKVQKYSSSPMFTFWFKVKDSASIDDEGTMESSQDFTQTGSHKKRPNSVTYCEDSELGKTEGAVVTDNVYPSTEYDLIVSSTSNKVVLKGSAFFNPVGSDAGTPVEGTIEGATTPAEKNGFYGDNILASDIPTPVAPAGYNFLGWSTDGSTVLDEAGITAKQFGGEGASVTPTTFIAVYEKADIQVTYTLGAGKGNGAKWSDTNNDTDKTVNHKMGDDLASEKTANGNLAVWDSYEFAGWTPASPDVVGTDALTFNAEWDGPFYTVKYFDKDGNQVGTTEKHEAGEALGTAPAGPAADGATFKKWAEKTDGKEPSEYAAMPAKNLEFAPVYEYTLTWDYNDNGTTAPDTENHEAGETFTTKADPTWGAHTFNGWVDADGKTPADYGNQMPAKAVTFKAQWDKFRLTVDLDGGAFGAGVTNPEGEYDDSANVPAPADPAKEGYTFAGWDPAWDADHPVVMDNNKTEKALWNVNTYTVTYDPNGGELAATATNPVSVEFDAAIPADPEATKTGSTFSGWDWYDADGNKLSAKPEKMPAGNLTAKAAWNGIDVTITFVDQDGTTPVGTVTGKYGDPVPADQIPTPTAPEGYEFDKWEPELPSTFTDNITVKAVYKAKKYNLTVDLDGGAFADDAMNPAGEYDYNESVAKPAADPVKEGFEFKGWSPEFPVIMTSDKTVKALWSGKASFTLDPGEGKKPDGTPYEPFEMDSNSSDYPEIPDPVLEGKEFAGWYWKDADGNTHKYDFSKSPEENIGAPVSGNIPLVAVYLDKHTVTYISDGATVKTESLLTGADLTAGVPADPTKEGFIFKGWKDASGKTPYDYGTMPDNDLTFTAEFAPVEEGKYTYTFVDRGNTISSGQLAEGDPIPTPSDPSRFGYKFAGWKPEVPTYMPAGDMTFEAQWEIDKKFVALVIGGTAVAGGVVAGVAAANTALIAGGAVVGGIVAVAIAANTHKVTYLVDGNTYRVFYILQGTKIIVPKDPTKDGCTFNGWDPEVPDVMPDHDLVFNAKFSGSGAGNNASDVISDVPATGSATAGLAVFAVISSACAAAYVIGKRKHS